MRAAVINGVGNKVIIRDVPVPKGEVLIRVAYCGLNHLDLLIRDGKRLGPKSFPHILGSEISGTVEKSTTPKFKRGDLVVVYPWTFCGKCVHCMQGNQQICDVGGTIGRTSQGGYAEFVAVPASNVLKIPSGVSLRDACAITLCGTTAVHLFSRIGNPRKGSVLITGASGGVGTIAVQLAKNNGCHVICTTASKKKGQLLMQLGAEMILSTSNFDTKLKRVDFCIDTMGGDVWTRAVNLLTKNGSMSFCGTTLDEPGYVPIGSAFARQINLYGSYGGSHADLLDALALLKKGSIKPVIDSTFSLEQVAAAQKKLEIMGAFGKILLQI